MPDKVIRRFQPYVKLVLGTGASIWFLLGTFATIDYVQTVRADVVTHADKNYQMNRELLLEMRRMLERIEQRTWEITKDR